jgi:hypothetical protein
MLHGLSARSPSRKSLSGVAIMCDKNKCNAIFTKLSPSKASPTLARLPHFAAGHKLSCSQHCARSHSVNRSNIKAARVRKELTFLNVGLLG